MVAGSISLENVAVGRISGRTSTAPSTGLVEVTSGGVGAPTGPAANICAPSLASLLDLMPKYVPTNPVIAPNSAVKNPSAVDILLKPLTKSNITMNPKKTAVTPRA